MTMNPAIDKTIETDRLCPGALHRIRNMAWDAGGKGINVSKTIRELGEKSIATGFLGGNAGKAIADSLSERGIEHDFIWLEGETRTNTKVLEEDGRVTELNEPGPEVRGEQMEQLLEKLSGYAGYAGKGTLFVLSGSLPSGADKQVYARIIRMAHEKGAEVLLDADGEAFRNALKEGPDIIKPNRAELRECAGFYGWLQEAPEGCGEAGYGEPFRKAEAGYGELFRATGGESGRIGGYPAASLSGGKMPGEGRWHSGCFHGKRGRFVCKGRIRSIRPGNPGSGAFHCGSRGRHGGGSCLRMEPEAWK